jgi:hypothetical protein
MPFMTEIRRDSPLDDDIRQDWRDLRTAIRIQLSIIKLKIRRNK